MQIFASQSRFNRNQNSKDKWVGGNNVARDRRLSPRPRTCRSKETFKLVSFLNIFYEAAEIYSRYQSLHSSLVYHS
jgi:hypothetical protein